jgi:transaldolase
MADPLGDLTRAGVAIWLDDLSRARLATGSLARLIRDWQIRGLGARGVGAAKALRALAVRDVSWACDLLRPIYDASQGVEGRVSIEVEPCSNTPSCPCSASSGPRWRGCSPTYTPSTA